MPGGRSIPTLDAIERRLKHLERMEGSYRADIRRAHENAKSDTVDSVKARERYEKIRDKSERRIERLQPKIRALISKREALKGARAGKG